MKFLHIISLGCSKNLVDSEVMLGRLKDYKITQDIQIADVIIINTCGFIEAAKKESLGHIFEALDSKKKDALVVASGCLVARYSDEIKKLIPEIDILTGVSDYDKIDSMIAKKKGILSKEVYLASHERVITGSNLHAYVKISEGCNQECSFCAIPSFKGKLQSKSINQILAEVQSLVLQGFKDFSFIAQDSSSYLLDFGVKDGLVSLILALEEQGLMKTARILYLYPSSTSSKLIEVIANSKIFENYFDMPIQHISQNVLKSMQRSHKDVIKLLKQMREVENSFVRSSIILGYPNENDEDFSQLESFLSEFRFDRLNIFEYSKEEGTKAYSLPQIPKATKTKRINKIGKLIKKQQKSLQEDMLGKTFKCIVEGKSKISEYFYSARLSLWGKEIDGEILINEGLDDLELKNDYYYVKITEVKDGLIIGKIDSKVCF